MFIKCANTASFLQNKIVIKKFYSTIKYYKIYHKRQKFYIDIAQYIIHKGNNNNKNPVYGQLPVRECLLL